MQLRVMSLKSFWERHRAQRWSVSVASSRKARTPKPFQPLTRDESLVILDDTVQWLIDEGRATLLMPDGPCKERCMAELRARDQCFARDLSRLTKRNAS